MVKKVFSYLKVFSDRQIKVDHQGLKVFPMLPTLDASFKGSTMMHLKNGMVGFPSLSGCQSSLIFFDSDHA